MFIMLMFLNIAMVFLKTFLTMFHASVNYFAVCYVNLYAQNSRVIFLKGIVFIIEDQIASPWSLKTIFGNRK